MKNELAYRNEDDKCYGATGMAVAIMVFNGDELLSSISLDETPSDMVEMHDMYYFPGNSGLSAKSAWNQIKDNFELSVAMMISNVMCRSLVLDKVAVPLNRKNIIKNIVAQEGRDTCGLEDDEINNVFDKEYTILYRVFNHQGVQNIIHDFADVLKRRRKMSRIEILEQLRALNML